MGRTLLVFAVAACSTEKQVPRDASIDAFRYLDAAADASPTCGPTGSCTLGPACGIGCCGPGERCVSGACTCGAQAACTDGNTCVTGGPIGAMSCGSVCCGTTLPCPI